MLIDHLRRIPEFACVAPTELRALAQRAQVLCIPANRWLAQRGHEPSGFFYLLRGELVTVGPRAVMRPAPEGALHHFYPGCIGVRTVLPSQVLRIDRMQREFLLTQSPSVTAQSGGIPRWLERFLQSDMMTQLDARHWPAIVGVFAPSRFVAGEDIIQEGARARRCFVMERGHAVVHRAGKTLRHLSPGDFFGEDALITGRCRNASVTALEDVTVQGIDQASFDRLLLDRLVRFTTNATFEADTGWTVETDIVLNVGCEPLQGAIQVCLPDLREVLANLDAGADYLIVGGLRKERALCAFLLTQRGVRARALV